MGIRFFSWIVVATSASIISAAFPAFAQTTYYISLKSHHGKYVVAENTGAANANRIRRGSWEVWELTDVNGGAFQSGDVVTLRGHHGKFLVAESDGRTNANRAEARSWEHWTVRFVVPGAFTSGKKVSFESAHGRYLVAEADGSLNANRVEAREWERFEVSWVPGPRLSRSNAANDLLSQIDEISPSATPLEVGIGNGITSNSFTHIQGMGVVGDFWVLSHDALGNRKSDLIVIDPEQRTRVNHFVYNMIGKDGYGAGAQGDGNFFAVSTGTNSQVRIFEIEPDKSVRELSHLRIDKPFDEGRVENVAMAYHHGHKRHYLLMVSNSRNELRMSSTPGLKGATSWVDVPLDLSPASLIQTSYQEIRGQKS